MCCLWQVTPEGGGLAFLVTPWVGLGNITIGNCYGGGEDEFMDIVM